MNRRTVRLKRGVAGAVAALCMARIAAAQARTCASADSASIAADAHARYAPPLDRVVSVRAIGLPLRDALDRVAAAGHLRLSYSNELLPLDRLVCVAEPSEQAGSLLAQLLRGTSVAAIGLGGDEVVLAPQTASPAHTTPDMAASLGVLDRVLITGTAIDAPQRAAPVAQQVIDGRALERENASSLSDALDMYSPGVWGWAQSPASLLSSYASIRGASSFGLSYPKIYIDGIEVANPLIVTRFDPASVDRIEVIRGPQSSALYGADAISGVINIVTRQDAPSDGMHAMLRTAAGMSHSAFSHDVLAQSHSASIAGGTASRSADLRVSGETMGAFVPEGFSRDLMVSGGARSIGERGTLAATARLFTQESGAAGTMFIDAPAPGDSGSAMRTGSSAPQSVTEYTFGINASAQPDGRWTHSFVAGIDGYRLSNAAAALGVLRTPADSALLAAQGVADRATLRATSELHLGASDATSAVLSLSAEHATLRETLTGLARSVSPGLQLPASARAEPIDVWQNTTGLTAQGSASFANTLFGTAGLRAEQDSRLAAWRGVALLPMVGATAVTDRDGLTFKLRAAYGKGIRPPSAPATAVMAAGTSMAAARAALGPEEQSGVEAGFDVSYGRTLALHVTRFDQRASGLIQGVAVDGGMRLPTGMVTLAPENVGEIANRGWELAASTAWSQLTATGALSFVDSRVLQLAPGYAGDLRTGDRALEVPARTASITAAWSASRWHASLGGSRAFDWINYDELALSRFLIGTDQRGGEPTGEVLRAFWRRYDGGFHLRAAASRDIGTGLALDISGENLLNHQRGEPDNITIVPGRTILTGLRLKF